MDLTKRVKWIYLRFTYRLSKNVSDQFDEIANNIDERNHGSKILAVTLFKKSTCTEREYKSYLQFLY